MTGCLNAEGTLALVLLGQAGRCGAVCGGCVHGESTVMVVSVSMCESIMMGCMPASTRPEFRRMPEAATWSYTGHRLATCNTRITALGAHELTTRWLACIHTLLS